MLTQESEKGADLRGQNECFGFNRPSLKVQGFKPVAIAGEDRAGFWEAQAKDDPRTINPQAM